MGTCASISPFEVEPFDPNVVGLDHFEIQRTLGKGGFGKVNAVIKKSDPMRGEWFALKTMQKVLLVRSKKWSRLRQNIFAERNILSEIKHPFICNSYYAFQDESNLYLVMDLALGGDLRYQLKCTNSGFTEEQTRFYTAQLILSLEKLHGERIIHQDIKPENLLMDGDGYIKLSDFGLSRRIEHRHCYEGAGTRGYIPPEVYREKNHRHSFSADWFAVGVTCYEFLKKVKPFKYTTIQKMPYESEARAKRLKTHVSTHRYPDKDDLSIECKTFVQGLIIAHPKLRLGAQGISEVKNHPWFHGLDWAALLARRLKDVPFLPDTSKANCEGVYDVRDCLGAEDQSMKLPLNKQDLFKGYEYNVYPALETGQYSPATLSQRRESRVPEEMAKMLSQTKISLGHSSASLLTTPTVAMTTVALTTPPKKKKTSIAAEPTTDAPITPQAPLVSLQTSPAATSDMGHTAESIFFKDTDVLSTEAAGSMGGRASHRSNRLVRYESAEGDSLQDGTMANDLSEQTLSPDEHGGDMEGEGEGEEETLDSLGTKHDNLVLHSESGER